MGPVVVLLGLIGAMVLWAFFNFPPAYANKKQVSVFNWCCVAVCAMFCLTWVLNINMIFSAPSVEKYRPFFLWGGALAIESVFFAVFFVLRNFWIFKPRFPGGRR